jgi:hypothetical protein
MMLRQDEAWKTTDTKLVTEDLRERSEERTREEERY